ncbi:MAG: Do family serine endopeptidase [Acidobacteriota bacterium]|nr:Do family serine endopeptidase [Acidobacteriota bacterium]
MLELPKGQTTAADRVILRQLRVWIAALAVACVVVGVGIGVLLTGHPAVAQNEVQIAARTPEALSASFADIARRVEPAVVNIDTVNSPQQTASKDGDSDEDEDDDSSSSAPSDNPLLEMFRKRQREQSARGVGSGFIIDPKGLILTNQHVVEGATRIIVKLQSGEELRGTVIGIDEETDIAVVQVKPSRPLPFVKLGNSDDAQVGDWVLAVGSPFGLEQTVTAGIISTRERGTPNGSPFQRFLQTDAAINRGNSGGPLVNMRGEVIGINSQIATTTGDYNGIGFALPANEAGFVYRQIVDAGKVQRGYLGIQPVSVKPEFARVYGLAEAKGAIVNNVVDAQGPAAKAGIQANDIIVEINGRQIASDQDLIAKVASIPVGQTAQVVYLREIGSKFERRTTSVVIGERPLRTSSPFSRTQPSATEKSKVKEVPTSDRPLLGLTLSELTPQIATERNLKDVRGLFIKDIDPNGLASDAGLRGGMVIQRVNRVPVTTLADFEKAINALKPGDAVVMNVATNYQDRVTQIIIQFTYQ